MAFAGVSYVAIVAAAAASFLFGGVWYGALSKQWMDAVGKSEADIKKTGMAVPMAITVVGLLVMAWVLAGIIGHLGPGRVTMWNGVVSAALVWLGFVASTIAVNHAFQGARPHLTLIDAGHWLGVLLIQGAIIGWIGVA